MKASTSTQTIYVKLLHEGVDAWRPVQAINEGWQIFTISPNAEIYNPDDEQWQFSPGQKVLVRPQQLSDNNVLVAYKISDPGSLSDRAHRVREMRPTLAVELFLYSRENGGRKSPFVPGMFCPCFADRDLKQGWDGCPVLEEGDKIEPGETRKLNMVFLSGVEAASSLSAAGQFYLWDGRIIGEAVSLGLPQL